MIVLLVLLALCVVALLYLQKQGVSDSLTQTRLDASADIEAAMERLAQDRQSEAELVTGAPEATAQKAFLVFEGVSDAADIQEIVDLLKEKGMDATFFFSGLDVLNEPDSISLPMDEGFSIGNSGYSANSNMETYSQKTVVSEICRAAVLIESVAGDQPTDLLFRQTTYSSDILSAAYACYIDRAIQPYCYIGLDTIGSQEQAEQLIAQIPRGSIICIRLSGVLSTEEEAAAKNLLATAVEQQASSASSDAETTDRTDGTTTEKAAADADILQIVRWLVDSLEQTDLGARAEQMVEQNEGAMEDGATRVYTTERAVCFTFSGLGENSELIYLLNKLDDLNARATFFVTAEEMTENAEQVELIRSRGHDLGIALQPTATETATAIAEEILLAKETLDNQFGYPDAFLVRQLLGTPTDGLRTAVAATGCTLCQQQLMAVQDRDENATDVDTIFGELFSEDSPVLAMGEIVHFRLNFFTGGDTLLGDLVEKVAEEQNIYAVRSLPEVITNTDMTYTYPLPDDQILEELLNRIYPGQLEGSAMNAIARRYIGTPWLSASMLPGFTTEEIRRLDRKGYLPNADDAVFLTFDDWGTDGTIMAILDVLREYNVKATFFIRTNNIHYNPNLLRAIAMEGHAIGGHTNMHLPLAIDEAGTGKTFRILNDEELDALQADLIESYDIMQHVVGDVTVDGRPSLTLLFRPPTLAVSRDGLEMVLDCGYSFSVSGSLSSQDYKATSAEKLAATIRSGLRAGSIIVMHMSDNSQYTAEALEIVLSENAAKAEDKQIKFARLDDYLVEGYRVG
jgi:peptidoglycan/xylan/chitin deacetylase (PgdA/CDA1 family)